MPISKRLQQKLDVLLPSLISKYPTPFHIYDEEGIVDTFDMMKNAFHPHKFRLYYAVKALPNPHILDILSRHGSGFDCASIIEMQLCRSIGASSDDILFTSNNTSEIEYNTALNNEALITFDDITTFKNANKLPKVVSFRVGPSTILNGDPAMGASDTSKFGVPHGEVIEAYKMARDRGVQSFGIHRMSYTNETDTDKAIKAASELILLAADISNSLGIKFNYINFGGGIGTPFRPTDNRFDFLRFAEKVINVINDLFPDTTPSVFLECGRYVTGPHGLLVSRVVDVYQKGRTVVGIDASMSALMRPAMYKHAYHHITLPNADSRRDEKVDIVGSLCENIDKFAVDRLMPSPKKGDIILIHDTGAHGHSMGFNYNGRLRPAELLLKQNGTIHEIRRAENYDDYVSTINDTPRTIAI